MYSEVTPYSCNYPYTRNRSHKQLEDIRKQGAYPGSRKLVCRIKQYIKDDVNCKTNVDPFYFKMCFVPNWMNQLQISERIRND